MDEVRKSTVDLITERPDGNGFVLVMVEQGPWGQDEIEPRLRRLQDRLNDYVDIALFGNLAQQFPSSQGMPVTIRLDCYELPRETVEGFFQRFAEHISSSSEITTRIQSGNFVGSLAFELNCRNEPASLPLQAQDATIR